jgi:hypothetical protein
MTDDKKVFNYRYVNIVIVIKGKPIEYYVLWIENSKDKEDVYWLKSDESPIARGLRNWCDWLGIFIAAVLKPLAPAT